MFQAYDGQRCAVHVGRRPWPDQVGWRKQLAAAGYSPEEQDRLAALPKGVRKGDIAGFVTLGRTVDRDGEAVRQRGGGAAGAARLEREVVATRKDMGRQVTAVTDPQWLEKGVSVPGQPGVCTCPSPSPSPSLFSASPPLVLHRDAHKRKFCNTLIFRN